jgi:hypothetical protein
MPGHHDGWVSPPPPFSSLLITFVFLTGSITGYFPCRSPISIDQLLKPPLVVASGILNLWSPLPRATRGRAGRMPVATWVAPKKRAVFRKWRQARSGAE